MEQLHLCQHTTVGKTGTRYQGIIALIQIYTILEGTAPGTTLLRILQERSRTIKVDAVDSEVAVVLRIIHSTVILIVHHELARGRSLLHGIVEIYVNPFATIGILILSLLGHLIHLSLDAQASGYIYEENLARAGVCKA